jgi:hypothetical protein
MNSCSQNLALASCSRSSAPTQNQNQHRASGLDRTFLEADYQALEIESFDPYTAYYFAWKEQREVIDPLARRNGVVAAAVLPERAALWGVQRLGLSGDEMMGVRLLYRDSQAAFGTVPAA